MPSFFIRHPLLLPNLVFSLRAALRLNVNASCSSLSVVVLGSDLIAASIKSLSVRFFILSDLASYLRGPVTTPPLREKRFIC